MGSIYKRGKVYWIKYYRSGKPYRESSESKKEADATGEAVWSTLAEKVIQKES